MRPYEPQYILAEQDHDGVNPESLQTALENYKKTGGKMPKVKNQLKTILNDYWRKTV